ncbi:MAG: DUF1330 domain-containing protein [Pseudomonadota bacterium]
MPEYVNPEREIFGQFQALDRRGPIHMLNLVRVYDQVTYDDGSQASGLEAYASYGKQSGPVFSRVGGKIIWSGDFELNLIGPQEERWDIAFIAEYPSANAFVEMVKDPIYQQAVRHRTLAVKDSRLVRMGPKTVSSEFG